MPVRPVSFRHLHGSDGRVVAVQMLAGGEPTSWFAEVREMEDGSLQFVKPDRDIDIVRGLPDAEVRES